MAKILLIDDSRFTRIKLTKFLQEKNFEVIEAENGQSGIALASSEQPDCIITDLLMPEMDGYAFLEQLKKDGLEIPVLVITADIQDTTRQKVLDLGAHAVLNKPADHAELHEMLTGVIAARGAQP